MINQDQAPGKPTDCALSRYIRAHLPNQTHVFEPHRSDLALLLSDNPADWDAFARAALLRR